MFDTTFSHASATPLPNTLSTPLALRTLHDFETVIKLSPDCRGCKPIPPPKNGYSKNHDGQQEKMQYYEIEDDLPFIPKRLWAGGVKYTADFLPVEDGCNITVHAPAGFTATNQWRIVRETADAVINADEAESHPANESHTDGDEMDVDEAPLSPTLTRTGTRDMDHADPSAAGWYVQIVSDARCPRMYAGFVKGFLKNSHAQLQHAFVDLLVQRAGEEREKEEGGKGVEGTKTGRKRRPTLGRRRSTNF